MTKDIRRTIDKISKKIVDDFKPEKIILFGSYAWGEPDENSDVDLFIVKETKKRSVDRERELRLMLYGNNFPALDLLVYTPEEIKRRLAMEDFFVKDILNKGEVIYDKRGIINRRVAKESKR